MSIYKILFLSLFLAFIFSSCISIKREIKLNSSGSGSEKITITLNKKEIYDLQTKLSSLGSDTASNNEDIAELKGLFEDTLYLSDIRESFSALEVSDSLKLVSVKEASTSDSLKIIEILYDFKDIKHLISDKAAIKPDNNGRKKKKPPITNVKIVKTTDAREFIYSLGNRADKDDHSSSDSLSVDSDGIMSMIFGDNSFEIQVEVPGDIISTNADSVIGRVVNWNNKMTDLLKNVKTLRVKYKK